MVKDKADLFSQLGDLRKESETQEPKTVRKTSQTGKRSNPDFIQVGAYILKTTDKDVKRLLVDEDGMDFSDLVQQLLEKWVREH